MKLAVDADRVAAAPAGDCRVTVRVVNDRDIVDAFSGRVADLAVDESVSDEVPLFPGDERDVHVRFVVSESVPAGPQAARIEMVSAADGTVGSIPLVVVVPPRQALSAELVPSAMVGWRQARAVLVLRNPGNVPVELLVEARDPAQALRFDLDVDLVLLRPKETVRIAMTVYGHPMVLGYAVPQAVSVLGRSRTGDLLVQAVGSFTIRPLLPRIFLTLLPLLAMLLVWALLFLVGLQKAARAVAGPKGTLSGRVTSAAPDAVPVKGAKVEAYRPGKTATPVSAAVTAADGTFKLTVRPGDYLVRATADGFDAAQPWYPQVASAADAHAVKVEEDHPTPLVEIELTGLPGSLAGSVGAGGVLVTVERLGSGVPMTPIAFFADAPDDGSGGGSPPDPTGPGPTTTTAPPGPAPPAFTPVATVTSAADGSFALTGLATPADYRLHFSLPGYAPATADVVLGPGEQRTGLSPVLAPLPASIVGTVLIGTTPAGGAAVTLTNGKTALQTTTATRPGNGLDVGGFLLPEVPPGPWTMTVAFGGLLPSVQSLTLAPGERRSLNVVL